MLTSKYILWIKAILNNSCKLIKESKGNLYIYTSAEHLKKVIFFLKNHTNTQCKVITDISGVDFPKKNQRFQVVYNLLSLRFNFRIFVKVSLSQNDSLDSIAAIFPGANWYEREVYDIFGIFFYKHPDFRRILTDYGFEGYPLRKDYPLMGYVEFRYSFKKKRLVCEPVSFAQTYRKYSFKEDKGYKSFCISKGISLLEF